MRGFILTVAAVIALTLTAMPAHAQWRIPGTGGTLNPYNYYDPYGLSRQAAFNTALYGRAMSQVPPYALGYNPYYSYGNYGVPSYYYSTPSYYTPSYSYYTPSYSYYSWYSAPSYYYRGGWRYRR